MLACTRLELEAPHFAELRTIRLGEQRDVSIEQRAAFGRAEWFVAPRPEQERRCDAQVCGTGCSPNQKHLTTPSAVFAARTHFIASSSMRRPTH